MVVDDDLTPDEEAALLVALLRWRVEAGMQAAAAGFDGCTRNDLTEVVVDARSHR